MNFFSEIGKYFPKKRLENLKEDLVNADLHIGPQEWVGTNLVIAVIIAVAVSAVIGSISGPLYAIPALLLALFSYYFVVSSVLGMLSDQRVRTVEELLPDVLLLISANLKSGVSPDEAISASARPEFGFFSDHIRMVGKKISTGIPIQEAMRELSKGIKSSLLNKTVNLVVEGMESGGELSTILEETAADIRDTEILQKEIRSVVFVYAIFIFIAAIIIAPLLYAVSTHLSQTLSRLSGDASVAFMTKGTGPTIVPSKITQDFLLIFSYANLVITSIFGALMISLITKGNERYGLKYVPIFITITIVLFFVARLIIGSFFQAIRI